MRVKSLFSPMFGFAALAYSLGGPVYAELVDQDIVPFKLTFEQPENERPLIAGSFSHLYGYSTSSDTASIYISCLPGRIDTFNFNIIVNTVAAEKLAENERYLIGVKSSEVNPKIVQQGPGNIDETPEIFGFNKVAEGFPEYVVPYSEYSISSIGQLYIESYATAEFLQAIADGDRLTLVTYFSEPGVYSNLFELYYVLDKPVLSDFFDACLK